MWKNIIICDEETLNMADLIGSLISVMYDWKKVWASVFWTSTDGSWEKEEGKYSRMARAVEEKWSSLEEKWDDAHFLRFCIPKQILNRGVKITQQCLCTCTHGDTHIRRVTDRQEGQQGSLQICSSANYLLAKHAGSPFSLSLSGSASVSLSAFNFFTNLPVPLTLALLLSFSFISLAALSGSAGPALWSRDEIASHVLEGLPRIWHNIADAPRRS